MKHAKVLDRDALLQRLADHLDAEAEALESAHRLLERMAAAMASHDVEALDTCVKAEPAVTACSADLAARRANLRGMLAPHLGVPPEQVTVRRAAATTGDPALRCRIENARTRVADAARAVRAVGYANAVVANNACSFYADLLGALAGREGGPAYDRDGRRETIASGSAALNTKL